VACKICVKAAACVEFFFSFRLFYDDKSTIRIRLLDFGKETQHVLNYTLHKLLLLLLLLLLLVVVVVVVVVVVQLVVDNYKCGEDVKL
jgi:hypothetical protein